MGPDAPSRTELDLLALLVTGATDQAAAERLGWSPRTVSRHLESGMRKLGAVSRLQAGYLVAQAGWLDADSRQPPGEGPQPSASNPGVRT